MLTAGSELRTLNMHATRSELGTFATGSELGTFRTLASGSELRTVEGSLLVVSCDPVRTLATSSELL